MSPFHARLLLVVTVFVTAFTTHWVDRATSFPVRRITPEEMTEVAAWLDDYYAAEAGLQRAGGLCEGGRLDRGALAAWLFQVYMQMRPRSTPEEAQAAIVAGIQDSEEWRRKHARQ